MALVTGAVSQVGVTGNTAQAHIAAPTGGTGPYTYQWYLSQTPAFTPAGGNLVAGATATTQTFSGLIPNTTYYLKCITTDPGHSNDVVTSAQLTVVTTPATLSQNQFAQEPYLGTVDLRMAPNTVAVQIDVSQTTALYAGSAVKMVDSAGGVPKVIGCTANDDEVLGFINFDKKTVAYTSGVSAEISMAGNAIYLYATAAIARGVAVQLDIVSPGSVKTLIPAGGANVVGWAFDKASTAGQLIRVVLKTPSFAFAD